MVSDAAGATVPGMLAAEMEVQLLSMYILGYCAPRSSKQILSSWQKQVAKICTALASDESLPVHNPLPDKDQDQHGLRKPH